MFDADSAQETSFSRPSKGFSSESSGIDIENKMLAC